MLDVHYVYIEMTEERILVTAMNLSSKTSLWVAGTLVAIIGFCVLFGWAFDINALKSVLPGLTTLKPTTAIGFLLVGLSMIVAPSSRERLALVVKLTSGLIVIIGLIELAQYLFDIDLGVDDLLFTVPPGASFTDLHPGRMTPQAAFEFALLGGSIFLLRYRQAIYMVQGMVLAGTIIPFAILVSYLFGMSSLPFFPSYKLMGVHTAFGFMVAASGVLASTVESGVFIRLHKYVPKAIASFAIVMLFLSAIAMIAAIHRVGASYLSVLQSHNEVASLSSEAISNNNRTYISLAFTLLLGIGLLLLNLQYLKQEILKRKRAEEELLVTASVFGNSQEGILITDVNNTIMDVNPAFTHITGYSREEVLGRNPKILSSGRQDNAFYKVMWQSLNQERAWRGEIWNRHKSGEIYAEQLSISAICDNDGKVLRYIAIFSDISHFKEHEAKLSRVAHYDALTGIPNRLLLADRMKQAIAQTSREKNMMAICYLDLDGFKPVNDTFGHEAGDKVLIEMARRIGNTIRGGDTVARLGGDEFVVMLLGLEKGEECMAMLERLLAVIAQPVAVKDNSLTLGASVGVSIYPLDDEDPDTLLRHADQAMYVAKKSGKNRFYIYDPAPDVCVRDQHDFLNGNGTCDVGRA